MSKRTHITIPDEVHEMINDYANKSGIKYSQAVAKLVESGLSNLELSKSINSYTGLLDRMFYKISYNTSLLEQFYSDMELDDLSNPNNNPALRKFRNKHSKYLMDD